MQNILGPVDLLTWYVYLHVFFTVKKLDVLSLRGVVFAKALKARKANINV